VEARYTLGADACVDKPVDRAEMIARLDEFTSRRILPVEDEAPLRYTMKRILERQYVVMEATNGKECLHAAATLAPSLVVLDLGLPDISGEEVLARLRSNPATAALPVVIATSRTLSDAECESLQSQAGGILFKEDLNDRLLEAAAGAIAPDAAAAPFP
jgi:CheY-like chemotaxis protein